MNDWGKLLKGARSSCTRRPPALADGRMLADETSPVRLAQADDGYDAPMPHPSRPARNRVAGDPVGRGPLP
jgi:hypothetical protein